MKTTAAVRGGIVGLVLAAVLWQGGCAPPQKTPAPVCPGKESVEEAIAVLRGQREALRPIQATGDMRITWYEEGKRRDERPSIRLRFDPPYNLFMLGNTVIGEMMRLGTNVEEFWLAIKPDEVDSYWWGRRKTMDRCAGSILVNPDNLLEALGVIDLDQDWRLTHEDGLDVLTAMTGGRPSKQILIDACDYRVRRIVYYDALGRQAARMELSEYRSVVEGMIAPTRIDLILPAGEEPDTEVHVMIGSTGEFEPTPRQLERLFARPDVEGYENVYRLTETCEFVAEIP